MIGEVDIVGREGMLPYGGISIAIRIKAIRWNFGRWDVLVAPIAGTGTMWVQAQSITLDQDNRITVEGAAR